MKTSNSIASSMRALVLTKASEDFELTETQLPVPSVGDGQVLIKVDYAALNPVDSKLAKTGHSAWQYPHIPALDGVGTVVDSYSPHCPLIGKQVLWHSDLSKAGALAEYVAIEAHAVSLLPEGVEPIKAAALPCAGMTAILALCKLQVEAGETILIEAGAGAVGQFAIQLAKAKGLTVLATASKANHKLVSCLGADHVFDYRDKHLVDKIKQALAYQLLDAVLDSVGGEATARDIELLRFNGRIACLTELPVIDAGLLFERSPAIHAISLGGAWLANDLCAQQKLSMMGDHLLELLASKQLHVPEIYSIEFDAEQVTKAMHAQLAGGLVGKQVVKVS